jgi:hypothetical protein
MVLVLQLGRLDLLKLLRQGRHSARIDQQGDEKSTGAKREREKRDGFGW